MQTTGSNKKILLLAVVALTEVFAVNLAIAAPPAAPQPKLLPRVGTTQNQAASAAPVSRLDLRVPARLLANDEKPSIFPSAVIHRQFGGADETAQLPSLGAGNPRIRPPLAELARHIQHEGLPVARIWENQSALVHIGLNQRGKPGLWLVQKIH